MKQGVKSWRDYGGDRVLESQDIEWQVHKQQWESEGQTATGHRQLQGGGGNEFPLKMGAL